MKAKPTIIILTIMYAMTLIPLGMLMLGFPSPLEAFISKGNLGESFLLLSIAYFGNMLLVVFPIFLGVLGYMAHKGYLTQMIHDIRTQSSFSDEKQRADDE
jgi:hypothetical protein